MNVIAHKKLFLIISGVLVVVSLLAVAVFGLRLGIDFTGGSVVEVSYSAGRPPVEEIENNLTALDVGTFSLRLAGEEGIILRTRTLSEDEHQLLLTVLSSNGTHQIIEERFNTVGPTIGTELRRKAIQSLIIVIIATVLFIAFTFRKVSKPVSSWKYGLIAIAALIHDIAIPAGVFAILGRFAGFEVDSLFVTALLVILGYSVNDTIVIFDRIRENLRLKTERHLTGETFAETVGKSLSETYARSFNTSLTVAIVLLALFFLGGSTLHNFTLTLLIGVIAGTYSSIFLASPLLVLWAPKSE
ncbi:protein translocase subunit SecF [Candidatus Wolfebacteria bacterium]|nr:protein translocase subunit SecF [Candidatus Wolfebacteria bacterium]